MSDLNPPIKRNNRISNSLNTNPTIQHIHKHHNIPHTTTIRHPAILQVSPTGTSKSHLYRLPNNKDPFSNTTNNLINSPHNTPSNTLSKLHSIRSSIIINIISSIINNTMETQIPIQEISTGTSIKAMDFIPIRAKLPMRLLQSLGRYSPYRMKRKLYKYKTHRGRRLSLLGRTTIGLIPHSFNLGNIDRKYKHSFAYFISRFFEHKF
jgi:hypothetical protein